MAMYRVVGIKTGECPSNQPAQHIVEAEITSSEGTRRTDASMLRFMISSGDNLFTVSPTTQARADVTKGRCECGFKTIRSVRHDVTDNDVTSLPALV